MTIQVPAASPDYQVRMLSDSTLEGLESAINACLREIGAAFTDVRYHAVVTADGPLHVALVLHVR